MKWCSYVSVCFFSSRRRHTRLQGDWSSDVCSSDLCAQGRIAHLGKPGDDRVEDPRSEEHTSELPSPCNLVCRLLLEKKTQKQGAAPGLGGHDDSGRAPAGGVTL